MNRVSIVVLSRYPEIFKQCHLSVEQYAKDFRRIVVIDRSQGETPIPDQFFARTRGWQAIRTWLPFSMARNGSFGMMAAWPDDVLYMGDDVQLQGTGDVWELQRIAYTREDVGILSPRISGSCGHHLQQLPGKQIKEDLELTTDLVFPCVFIKRRVLDEIGYLDLRYSGYGGDDIDFCRRAQAAGWQLAVTDRVRVVHGYGPYKGTATFQMRGCDTAVEVAAAAVKMEEKAWEANFDGARE